MPSHFKCATCGIIYETARSDDEALDELEALFPGTTPEECEVVCDDCWHAMGFGE